MPSYRIKALGTIIRLTLTADQPDHLAQLAKAWLADQELVFSLHDPNSQLSRLNQAAGQQPLTCSPLLMDLIEQGKAASLAPASQLNIAIAPLVKAWRIGFSGARRPQELEIDQLLPLCDPSLIQIDKTSNQVYLPLAGMGLDLGALAKGYLADRLLEELRQAGGRQVLIDCGSSIVSYSQNPLDSWAIGLQKPGAGPGQTLGQIQLQAGQALTTSGTYQRVAHLDGQDYHHLLDPKTGMPLKTEMTSLTVISPTGLTGELLTSQLFGKAVKQVLAELQAQPACQGLILTQQKTIHLTSGMKPLFSPHYHEKLVT